MNRFINILFLFFVVVALLVFHDFVSLVATSIPAWIYTVLLVIQIITGVVIVKVSNEKSGDVIGTIITVVGVIEFIYHIS